MSVKDLLKNIADAIRSKTGKTEPINAQDFTSEINGITTLKALLDARKDGSYLFQYTKGIYSLEGLIKYDDTSNITKANHMFESTSIREVPLINTSSVTSMQFFCCACNSLTKVPLIDTSKVTSADYMFSNAHKLVELPELDFSKINSASYMFNNCIKLTKLPTSMNNMKISGEADYMFNSCWELTEIPSIDISSAYSFYSFLDGCCKLTTVSHLDFSNAGDLIQTFNCCSLIKEIPEIKSKKVWRICNIFQSCSSLETVHGLNLISLTKDANAERAFYNCKKLTNLNVTNIKVSLQVASGTWGNLLTLDSLIGLCKECIKQSSSKTLTVGTINLEKIADVYVKFTDSSVTTISTGAKGEVEVCESTDEGAMLISDYMALKNWTLA